MSLSLDENTIIKEIDSALNTDDLEKLRLKFLGKKGLISNEMKLLSSLAIEEKKN